MVALLLLFVVRGFIPAWGGFGFRFCRLLSGGPPLSRGVPGSSETYEWTWFQHQKDHAGIEQPLVGFIPATLTSGLTILPVSSPFLLCKQIAVGSLSVSGFCFAGCRAFQVNHEFDLATSWRSDLPGSGTAP